MKRTFARFMTLCLFAIPLQISTSFSGPLESQVASDTCMAIEYNQLQGIRGTISIPGEKDCFTFDGEAGQRVNVYLFSSGRSLTLTNPDSSTLAFYNATSGDCEIDDVTLPTSGKYTLTVAFEGNATGDYFFFLNRLDGDAKPISFGQVIESDIHPPGDQDSFTFEGQAGQRINAFLDNEPYLGISLNLLKPNGESFAFCDFSGAYCQIDDIPLPVTGTYTLTVDGRQDYMGLYDLTLNRLDGDAELITYGQSLDREISPKGDQDSFVFNGASGERVTLFLDNKTSGNLSLLLSNPDGSVYALCDLSSGDCQIDDVTLPTTGVYTVTVDGEGRATGNYTLALNRLDEDVEPITYDQALLRELSPMGDQDSFTFNGQAGQRVTVFLDNQTPGNLSLRLNNPNGNTFVLCDFTNGDCQIDNVSLLTTGVYTIIIDGQDEALGNYAIALNRLDGDAKPITYGQSISSEISPAGDQDEFTFAGLAGQRVTVFLENSAAFLARFSLRLTNPDGSTLALCDFSDVSCRINNVTLPDTGVYTLTVDGYYSAVGNYVLNLSGTTQVQADENGLPRRFELSQNYPNPFNPATTIYFQIPKPSHVMIKIFDVQGREVRTLVDHQFAAGKFMEIWDGRKNDGTPMMSGEYFMQMQTTEFLSIKKMLLMR